MCRASLTPIPAVEEQNDSVQFDFSMGYREQIIARNIARRDVIRLRNNQREHEERRALALAAESDKENRRA